MAEYKSQYTGQEIDAGIGKANTATQPEDLYEYQTKTDVSLQTSSREIVGAINELNTKFISVYRFKGTVSTYSSLPTNGLSVGDVYNIENEDIEHNIKAGDNVAWTDVGWDVLGGTVDLSGYQTLIDSSHKLSADLVDDTNKTNKFVTNQEKQTWNNKGTYSKPASGIPETDLSQAVQAILEKANATNLSTYEFNETDIGQTVINYIVNNNPDVLKITTQQTGVQDYYKGEDKQYFCVAGGQFIILKIIGSEGSYNVDIKSYDFDEFSEVSGTNDGTNWTSITIDGTTKNIPTGGGSGTNVEANPTLDGTEAHLDGLKVGSTKYSTRPDLSGKVISIMGDSISTYAGWIPNSDGVNDGTGTLRHAIFYPNYGSYVNNVNMTWWHKLIFDKFKAKFGINESWSGSFVGNNKDTNTATTTTCHAPGNDTGPDTCMASNTRILRLGANGTPDIIYVYGGTNDIAQPGTPGESLGTFNSGTDYSTVDTSTTKWAYFVDAYRTMIQRMQYYYPKAKIIALLPAYCNSYYNRATLDSWVEQIKAICDYFGVNYIDLRACGITWANSASSRNAKGIQTLGDSNIHPNDLGHTMIADYVEAETYKILQQDSIENVVHTVTNTLTTLTNNKSYITGVSDGESYTGTLTGADLTVGRVSMNGTDITSTAYNDSTGVITIANVTGDIVISEGQAVPTAVTGVSLNAQTKSIMPNDVETLTATIIPANATNKNVTWSVNNNKVTIVPNGLTCQVTGVSNGTSVVTVTTQDGSFTDSCTFTIHEIELESIAITTPPSTTAYHYGDTFSKTGMVVTAYYDDETSEVLDDSDYTVSPSGALTDSDTSVTISYTYNGVTKTATQNITVATLSSIAVTTQPTKITYYVGDTFDPTGMIVTATWSDNTTSTVTGYTYTPDTALTANDTTITISYTVGGVTRTATQSITVSASTETTAVFGTVSSANAVSNTVFWQTNTDDMVAARGNQLKSITFNHRVTTGTIKVYGYDQSFDKTASASALASAATTANNNKTLLFTITPKATGSQTYLLDGTDANVSLAVSTPIYCPTSLGFDGVAMSWSGTGGETTNNYITFCSNSAGGNVKNQTICVSLTYLTSSSKTLTAIAVTTAPTKTSYYAGEYFDPTGMIVTATFSDNTTAVASGYTYSPTSALTTSDSAITISYTWGGVTQSTTQAITVNQAPSAYYHTDNINLPLNAEAKPSYASFINYSDKTYFEGKTITSVRFKPYKAGTLTVGLINIANWSATSSKTNATTITVNANDVGVVTEYPISLQCPVGYGPYIMETTDTATFYYSETGGNGFKNQVGKGRTPGDSDPCNLGVDFGIAQTTTWYSSNYNANTLNASARPIYAGFAYSSGTHDSDGLQMNRVRFVLDTAGTFTVGKCSSDYTTITDSEQITITGSSGDVIEASLGKTYTLQNGEHFFISQSSDTGIFKYTNRSVPATRGDRSFMVKVGTANPTINSTTQADIMKECIAVDFGLTS